MHFKPWVGALHNCGILELLQVRNCSEDAFKPCCWSVLVGPQTDLLHSGPTASKNLLWRCIQKPLYNFTTWEVSKLRMCVCSNRAATWGANADGVAKGDFVAAHLIELLRNLRNFRRRHGPFNGTRDRARHVSACTISVYEYMFLLALEHAILVLSKISWSTPVYPTSIYANRVLFIEQTQSGLL